MGYIMDEIGYPALIAEWMEFGTVLVYLENHPEANAFDMVSINFSLTHWHAVLNSESLRGRIHLSNEKIKGIAAGLQYLHKKAVIHSDLKSVRFLSDTRCSIPVLKGVLG